MQEYDEDVRDYARSYYVGFNYADIAQNTNLFLNVVTCSPWADLGFG
jgi:hypothetical protein